MKSPYAKPLILGFLFGTLGMFILAMLSLVLQPVEWATAILFAPGRFMSAQFAGPDGSNLEVALLTLFNGVFYAAFFLLVRWIISLIRARKT